VSLESDGGSIVCSVCDCGPFVPPSQRSSEHVVEELELELGQLKTGQGDRFLSACGVSPAQAAVTLARAGQIAGELGAALLRVELTGPSPEEVRKFEGDSGQLELVNLDAGAVGRATFKPGWKWSEHVKPIAGTDSCQAAHTCYFVSGRMKVVMDDGEEMEYGPGDFAIMPPGHDAWIVGDEPCVVIDWQGFADYAKPA
jgi:quercetin dioxygenase-like cupin family protein